MRGTAVSVVSAAYGFWFAVGASFGRESRLVKTPPRRLRAHADLGTERHTARDDDDVHRDDEFRPGDAKGAHDFDRARRPGRATRARGRRARGERIRATWTLGVDDVVSRAVSDDATIEGERLWV